MTNKKCLAVYDFDGTITHRDSFISFLKFVKPDLAFYFHLWLSMPDIFLYGSGLMNKKMLKEKLLQTFCGKLSVVQFKKLCDQFSENEIQKIIRPRAFENIIQQKADGYEVVILTASIENYLLDWCRKLKLKLIGTKLIQDKNKMLFEIDGENCSGSEKVKRLLMVYDLKEFEITIGYGNTKSDLPFMNLMTESHYKPFRD